DDFERRVIDALDRGDRDEVNVLVLPLHHSDLADLFERLSADQRKSLFGHIRENLTPELFSELDETVRDELIDELGIENLAGFVRELDSDDAIQIIEELEEDEQQAVLDAIPPEDRALIEEGLSYPEYSAGRLMQRELVAVPSFWNVGEIIDYLREMADRDEDALPEDFYDIFIIDPAHRPVGMVSISRAMRTKRPVKVSDIMDTSLDLIQATMDQEDVAFMFRQRDLVSAPVVDDDGRLVGVITVDDVVDVIHEEHEEDFMRLGGVPAGDFYSSVIDTTRSRFVWLLVNLGTAILASLIIGMFDATIEQMVALAVLMPIVASMGGNAGTQTLTVAVRALATKELTPTNAMRVIGKEILVGSANGVLFAVLTGAVALFWFDSTAIALVIAAAMVINLVVAGLAGAAIPLALERAGVDPAVASSVFLTTVTDVVGFFAFLGLAAIFLM
ncbi:MAG: magnesium transporter, partial [Rhodospirillales bacterium]|nr:magnesium transporter [Rhodospirillales bacterium]